MIKAIVSYLQNGKLERKPMTAANEETLLSDVFCWSAENYRNLEITRVEYAGEILRWNDFLAHHTFAKGKLSFEEFKNLCTTANMTEQMG